jgi:hypothetical protein
VSLFSESPPNGYVLHIIIIQIIIRLTGRFALPISGSLSRFGSLSNPAEYAVFAHDSLRKGRSMERT